MTVLEPNILYLDEKPPKIVKTKKITTNKKSTKKAPIKVKNKQKIPLTSKKRSTKIKQDNIIKKELCKYKEQQKNIEHNDTHDPLYTAKLEIKCDLDDENPYNSMEYDCQSDEQEDYDDDDDHDHDYNYEHDKFESKLEKSNDEDEDDEPLILLSRRKGRPRKKIQQLDDENIKAPRNVVCRESCKLHCIEKFNEEQRKNICDYYWNLNKEDRVVFIRKHIRATRLTRMKRLKVNKISANNSYYLKPYKIGIDETTPEHCKDLIRVCRQFFEATLCTTNQFIKKANDGTVLEIEKELMLLSQMKLAKEKEKSQEHKQILDPETGNLITLEPGTSNKTANPKPQNPAQDKPEKKKHIRRKPGDPVPEHFPKPINCAVRCIHKCHTKFSEDERKQICDLFWSMDFKRRKDFILANLEIKDIENQTTPDFRTSNRPPRTHQRRFFLRSGGMRGENLRVCKDFYTKTLCITGCFIDNAVQFADKTTGCYTGSDRRGGFVPNKKTEARKQVVLNHIDSYPFWIPNRKTKTKYLHHSLTIKKMYDAYKEKCVADKISYVSTFYYYTAFHDHFNLLFLANPHPKKGCALQKGNPNISHYTGEEPGGCWIDSKGNKLDLRSINPAQSLNICQHDSFADVSENTSVTAATSASHYAFNTVNPTSFMPSLASHPTPYGNLHQDPINMFKML